jgi:hypothetical protein
MDDERIRGAELEAKYVASVRDLYGVGSFTAIEIAEPVVVLKTPTGARVLAWLPVEDEDLTA